MGQKIVATILIALATSIKSFSQQKDLIDFIGKWAVFVSLKKVDKCENPYVIYEFYEDETFKDARKQIDGDGEKLTVSGKWKYKDNVLIIDYDDTKNSQSPPRAYNIVFIDKNMFYEVGKEYQEGPDVYTYFQRIR